MKISNLFKLTQTERNKFSIKIIESSAPRVDYYFLVILSTLIVTLGLLADNVILVIGGMLVTPLLSPVLAIAIGIVISDQKVIAWSFRVFLSSFILGFLVALIAGFFSGVDLLTINIIGAMEPSLFFFFIAIVAGLAASYTWAKPNLNETLPGIAVTVTLIPPLAAIGLAVSHGEWLLAITVLKVLLLNIFGIIAASLLIFSLMDFYKAKKRVIAEIKEEEKLVEKEKKQDEKEQLKKMK